MYKTLFGISAVIASVALLLVSIGMLNVAVAYKTSLDKQSVLADKSANIIDSVATTIFLKVAKKSDDISPEDHDAILAALTEQSKNGFLFERLLLAMKWDKNGNKEDSSGSAQSEDSNVAADGNVTVPENCAESPDADLP